MNEEHALIRDGTPVLVRQLTPADATFYPDFLRDVTAEDLRLRFFASMRKVSDDLIDKLIHYDPTHAMAFIVIEEHPLRMLGVVRLHDDKNAENAEFAILVRSQLKGRGIGWLLMKRIIEYAKGKSLKTMHGQVLAENATMLSMCSELGFHVVDDIDDPGVKEATLTLRADR